MWKILFLMPPVHIRLRKAKENKDFATSDEIRNKLIEANIQVKDGKEGSSWSI